MTKEEIKKESTIGLSEDVDGEFYTIYDFDKLYNLVIDKACEFAKSKYKGWWNDQIEQNFREEMNK